MKTPLENIEEWLINNLIKTDNKIEHEAFTDCLKECRRLMPYERSIISVSYEKGVLYGDTVQSGNIYFVETFINK